jgi:transcriptional regulator with XRE-family HTH domain
MNQREIIDKLFKARVSNRISQLTLSEDLGYHFTLIQRAEKGNRTPRLQEACDWAEALGLEIVVRPKE